MSTQQKQSTWCQAACDFERDGQEHTVHFRYHSRSGEIDTQWRITKYEDDGCLSDVTDTAPQDVRQAADKVASEYIDALRDWQRYGREED